MADADGQANRKEETMTVRTVKAVAAITNLALLGLTVFLVTRGGVELEGLFGILFLLMILVPVVNLAALYWPNPLPSAVPASRGATEDQR
jgi:hypothetical protein